MSDNASNNDKMVEEMAGLLENFPGAANQTRCFLHILNLTAKSILHQFEIPPKPKKKSGNDSGDDDSKVPISVIEALSWFSAILVNKICKNIKIFE